MRIVAQRLGTEPLILDELVSGPNEAAYLAERLTGWTMRSSDAVDMREGTLLIQNGEVTVRIGDGPPDSQVGYTFSSELGTWIISRYIKPTSRMLNVRWAPGETLNLVSKP